MTDTFRALCADLLVQCDAGEMAPVEAMEDIRTALAQPESEGYQAIAKRAIESCLAQRDEVLAAFIAKHGLQPEDAIQVEQRQPDGTSTWRIERRPKPQPEQEGPGPVDYRRWHEAHSEDCNTWSEQPTAPLTLRTTVEALAWANYCLARWGRAELAKPESSADREVAELVAWLRDRANSTSLAHTARRITRVADLLERLAQPEPEGSSAAELLPVEPPNISTTMALQYRTAWREGVEDGWNEARAVLARFGRPAIEPVDEDMTIDGVVLKSGTRILFKNVFDESLPDWAIDRTDKYCVGAQLPTRDGRRVGNAVIAHNHFPNPSPWEVVTDAGSTMRLNEAELHELYWPPQYIMAVDTSPGVRARATRDPGF